MTPKGGDAMVSVIVNLAEVMAERGIKDAELAERCRLDSTMIQKIRTHQRLPSLRTLAKIACALDVSLDRLVTVKPGNGDVSLSA